MLSRLRAALLLLLLAGNLAVPAHAGVRESGGSSRNFLHVIFSSNGTFSAWDEVDTGLVALDVDLLFESTDGYYVLIRESGSSGSSFVNLIFLPSTYRMRAGSARATKSSLVDVIITCPPEETFRDGFE